MKAALLMLLVASVAFADDAPKVVVLAPGEAAQEQMLCMSEGTAITQAQRVKGCEAENAQHVENQKASTVRTVLVFVGGLLVGGAVAAGVAVAIKK